MPPKDKDLPTLTGISFQSQEAEERVVFLLRPHWITNLGWLVMLLTGVIIPIFLFQLLGFIQLDLLAALPLNLRLILTFWWYLFLLAWAFERLVSWYFNVVIITDHRLVDIDFWGYTSRRVSETPLAKIQDATYKVTGFLPSLFNYGDINIQTAAEVPEFECRQVPNPERVHDVITDLMEKKHE